MRCTIVLMLLAGCMAAGCSQAVPSTNRALGQVSYQQAFDTARTVFSEYYSVADADAATGLIRSRPQQGPVDRVLSRNNGREIATMQLSRDGERVAAAMTIEVQRMESPTIRQLGRAGDTYSQVPDQTPAEADAPLTREQSQTWRTVSYNHAMERKILDELYRRLHPQEAPATAPAQ
jgi:hypothetical protein